MRRPAGAFRYNPPPSWPAPPAADWSPKDGWEPLAEWGPPPEDWVFWSPMDDAEEGRVRHRSKSWAEIKQEQADKRAAKGKPPIKSFSEVRAEHKALTTPPESPPGTSRAGWWLGISKVTVAVNVRYLNAKTLTKSMGMGTLKLNPEQGITWRANLGPKVVIPWSSIEAIDIDGESTTRLTLTRAATLGVFALGAKKKKTDTTMLIATPTKEYAFEFEKTQPTVVRNKMRPVLSALAAATSPATESILPEPATPAPTAADIPDQIQRLATLRDQGILSADEFDSKKAELLARM